MHPYAMNVNVVHHPHVHHQLLRTIQDCETTCEHMITMILGYPDITSRASQIQLLRDCAHICATTAAFLARLSGFSRTLAHVCAMICEMCGCECAKFPDQASQHCAQVCLHCARECRAFAGAM